MKNIQNQTKILLVGENLGRREKMLNAFRKGEFKLLFAADRDEGFLVARLQRPNLIISEFDLPGGSGLDLCRMIRTDINLCSTAFVFFSENHRESENIQTALQSGADDCFADFFTPQFLVAKAVWLIERKSSEEALCEHYQIMRRNQVQILSIIKQTADLIVDTDYQPKTEKSDIEQIREFEKFICQRQNLGIGMIGALANLVDEQLRACQDFWEGSLRREPITGREIKNDVRAQRYYKISCN